MVVWQEVPPPPWGPGGEGTTLEGDTYKYKTRPQQTIQKPIILDTNLTYPTQNSYSGLNKSQVDYTNPNQI